MNLFEFFTVGQPVKVVTYDDELNAIPTHYRRVGKIGGIVCDFYRVDFGVTIDGSKLEAGANRTFMPQNTNNYGFA